MKPAEYRHSYTVSEEIPYSVVEQSSKGTQSGVGTLHTGRVIWLEDELDTATSKTVLRAYAEGIGFINVDQGSLSATS